MESRGLDRIKQFGRCCCCTRPLRDNLYTTAIQLDLIATWRYPTYANVFYANRPPGALAFVCDPCAERARELGRFEPAICWAIQLTGEGSILYWPVDALVERPPDPTYVVSETLDGRPAITCLRCNRVSHHPEDVDNLYCGFCHEFHAPA